MRDRKEKCDECKYACETRLVWDLENSFLTYGGNGVRHMGKMGCVGELKPPQKENSFLTYGGNEVRHMGKMGWWRWHM